MEVIWILITVAFDPTASMVTRSYGAGIDQSLVSFAEILDMPAFNQWFEKSDTRTDVLKRVRLALEQGGIGLADYRGGIIYTFRERISIKANIQQIEAQVSID